MTEAEAPSPESGCLALAVSVAVVSAILTFGTSLTSMSPSPALYLPIFIVTGLIVSAIGMPLYGLARRLRWTTPIAAIALGAITGAAVPLISAVSDGGARAWREVAAYALIGSIGGLVFFLTATAPRNPACNIAVLLAIVGASAALTPLLSALIS